MTPKITRSDESPMFGICNKKTYRDKILHQTMTEEMIQDPMYISLWLNIGKELLA